MTNETLNPNREPADEPALEGWKDIANYLKRGVRTVKRWEKNEGLPVRRHQHQARSSVYAYPSELDAWLATRQPAAEKPGLWFRRPVSTLAMTAVLLLALASVASGPLVNPPGAAAEEAEGIVLRRVVGGPRVDTSGDISPDGRYLSLVHWGSGALVIVDTAALAGLDTSQISFEEWKQKFHPVTTDATWLTNSTAYYSIWSPDGEQLAYLWFNKGKPELRITRRDEYRPRVLLREEERAAAPMDWSHNGEDILVVFRTSERTHQIALVSVADGSVRILKSLDWRYPRKASLSPDGRYIVYDLQPDQDSPQRDIYLLATDGSREIALVEHPANDYGPVWAPDGQTIVFASDRTGDYGAWALRVADGKAQGEPLLLKRRLGRFVPLGFTHNGDFYYTHSGFENRGDVYIARLDPTGGKVLGEPKKATGRYEGINSLSAWSPDGQHLAYVSGRQQPFGGNSNVLVIRNLETGEERQLTPDLSNFTSPDQYPPQWSPDGESILLTAADTQGRRGFYLVDVETGAVTPLLRIEPLPELGVNAYLAQHWPVFSPDGDRLYFVRFEAEEGEVQPKLVARDLDTKREQTLYEGPIGFGLAVSPDGRHLVFRTFNREAPERGTALYVLPTTGGEPREILRMQYPETITYNTRLAWTPGGYILFGKWTFPDYEHIELWRVPAAGGEPENMGLEMVRLRNISLHPDGRRLTFAAGWKIGGEIWVIENLLPQSEVAQAE